MEIFILGICWLKEKVDQFSPFFKQEWKNYEWMVDQMKKHLISFKFLSIYNITIYMV